jgi:hypothetical protein
VRRVVIAAFALVVLLPGVATAVPSAPAAPNASGKGALSGMFELPGGELVAAGDLNGDGRADVLDVRGLTDESSTVGITARGGRTGKPLWSKTVPVPPNGQVTVLPERLGAAGKPAVLVTDSFLGSGTTATQTVSLEALAGATGKRLWSRSFVGTYGASAVPTSIPTFDGVIHDVKGPAMDMLVTLETTLPSAGGDRTTPVIVSGVNGSLHHPGSAFTSTAGFPSFQAVPDMTGDRLADLLVLDPGSPGLVEAEHGHTGALFWKRSQPVDSFTSVMAIGSYSRPSSSDVAVIDGSPIGDDDITVLSGHGGHKLWSREAGGVYLLGKAGKHLQPALGLVTVGGSSTTTTSSETIDYQAVAVSGRLIYSKRLAATVTDPPGTDGGGSGAGFNPLGDVQPDGAIDQIASLMIEQDSPTKAASASLYGIVYGRTGAFHKVSFDVGADGSLRKGAGTDLLQVELPKGTAQIIARRGLTGKRYYARTLPGLRHLEGAIVNGLRVSGQRCSDIALTTSRGDTSTSGVLSARGVPLWRVTFDASQATGGTLQHFKAPKHYCV